MNHLGKRLFITGIPTAGKTQLAAQLAQRVGGYSVCLDDHREALAKDDRYKMWVNFYLDQDEKTYYETHRPDELWNDLLQQSEGLWPALLEEIQSYTTESDVVIFESVNILPHLAKRDLKFPGLVLLGSSYEETLKRNMESPRWGTTKQLQELEARAFWNTERPRYQDAADEFGYPTFANFEKALEKGRALLQ